MRIGRFEIVNYKGIARASLDDIAREPVVMLSGRNGTGKSLVLEALVGVWTGRYAIQERVGPWGDQVSVELGFALAEDEYSAANDWHTKQSGQPLPKKDLYLMRHVGNRLTNSAQLAMADEAIGILRNTNFQREHPFAIVDFLPATRSVPAAPSPTVDLAMLNIERVEQERISMLDTFMTQRGPISLPNVANYLVTLDYQAFLAARQGLDVSDDYDRIASAFTGATGKKLLRPEYDPSRGSNIEVSPPVIIATGSETCRVESKRCWR